MNTSDAKATGFSSGEEDFPLYLSEWLKRRRQELDLTQEQLAQRASCSVFAIRKLESGERRPSVQLARMLAQSLEIPGEDQAVFIKAARGELSMERLASLARTPSGESQPAVTSSPLPVNLPRALTPFIGREPELAALVQMLHDPQCLLLTIVGPGGIGKTRLAVEVAARQRNIFPDGVWFVPLAPLSSSEYVIPAIADALKFRFQGPATPQEQLLNYLYNKKALLLLDNAEHLLDGAGLFTEILKRSPQVKLLVTSRERLNLLSEWVFEIHGLPVPPNDETEQFEEYSSVALFLQSARRVQTGFLIRGDDRPWILNICQTMEGMPLGIELSAAWVGLLSCEEIAKQIEHNIDFLSVSMHDLPERHRSIRAVFDHSWKLLSDEERNVLCRLAVFRGGFQRQAAEQIAGASLPILMSLLSKSLLLRRDDGYYDLHELIYQCALQKLYESEDFEETCRLHLAYFVSFASAAYQGLRSAQMAEWLRRIERDHNNLRAALEWAFASAAPSERVEEGLCLITSTDRYWARGLIDEGITWLKRGLQASHTVSIARARALRMAGVLYNMRDDEETATRLLQESLAISRQLNDEVCQANALDTLGDMAWLFGDFPKAKAYYAESLALFRKIGDVRSIGLSLASAGRLHVDYGYYQEAERLSLEGLSHLDSVSDLRGRGYCLNALGRAAILQGDVKLAALRFRQALRLNYELNYLVDIAEIMHEIAVVEAISGNQSRAVLILAAATALAKKIGTHYPADDPVDRQAPAGWLQVAPFSEEWAKGEMMSMDQAVAYSLDEENE